MGHVELDLILLIANIMTELHFINLFYVLRTEHLIRTVKVLTFNLKLSHSFRILNYEQKYS